MKKILSAIIITFFLAFPSLGLTAGSSVTQTGTGYGFSGRLLNRSGFTNSAKYTVLLTSDDATGAVTGALIMDDIMGLWITKVRCYPDGTDTPTALYDLTITDNGLDVMGGNLADRTEATTGDQALPKIGDSEGPTQITGDLTISGEHMGNSKKVTVVIDLTW